MNKKTCPILVTLGLFLLVALSFLVSKYAVVYADLTDTVQAYITAEVISVAIDEDTIPFGVVGTGSTQNTTSLGLGDGPPEYTITATNNGSVAEDFDIAGDDSTNWTLAADAASEVFTLDHCVTTCDTSPLWVQSGIGASFVEFANNIAALGTSDVDLQVGTPTFTTHVTEESFTVTIQASKHL
ncbi:MAG: hypothetical protein WC243_04690 [Patescibacteria group bacterium]|jgi:hypothetical protein